jgi:hypothetical protein
MAAFSRNMVVRTGREKFQAGYLRRRAGPGIVYLPYTHLTNLPTDNHQIFCIFILFLRRPTGHQTWRRRIPLVGRLAAGEGRCPSPESNGLFDGECPPPLKTVILASGSCPDTLHDPKPIPGIFTGPYCPLHSPKKNGILRR